MQKQAPSLARIAAMALFTLSCFGLLTFLWVSFGGPVPLRPKPYQVKVNFPDAATLANQADVRISGVNVGKVETLTLDRGASRETAVLSIDPKFAPLRANVKAILRQKTLLGETYVELTPGTASARKLPDGATVSNAQVAPVVTLDEILRIFNPQTRQAFRAWLATTARAFGGTAPQDLNDALGNLTAFAQDGAGTLSVLNTQSVALQQFIHNTGVVFGAINERTGALRGLIENSDATFSALNREQAALADVFRVFPTFLGQSRLTFARLQSFSNNARPLVNALKPVADKIAPTFNDLGALAPDLTDLFRRLRPVIRASTTDLGAGARFLNGTPQVLHGLTVFLPQLNPVLSYLNYTPAIFAHFLANGAYATLFHQAATGDGQPHNLLGFDGIIGDKSFAFSSTIPPWDRGNTYDLPNWFQRAVALGAPESFNCRHTLSGGEERETPPSGPPGSPTADGFPPCFVAPAQLYDNLKYPQLEKGQVRLKPPPTGLQGNGPPPDYNRPLGGGG